MISFPNCKINIGLYITGRRADGYHNLETVFFPIPLQDTLEILKADNTVLNISGRNIPGEPNNNLVLKAYNLLLNKFPSKIPPFNIYLHKVIPLGGGLGGGSSDGAFMLKTINSYCNLRLSNDEMANLALQLGSDCPFFIYNKPQFATGRGEQMTKIAIDLSDYSLQFIFPNIPISTSMAFGLIKPQPATFNLCNLNKLPIAEWNENIQNIFEPPVFQKYPELASIKQQLYQQGAIYASMSGSGSTIYGIFPKNKKALINLDTEFETYYLVNV